MRISPVTGILAANIFLSGATFASTAPYRAIVGVETLGLSNATYALVMALNAIGGAVAAVILGWMSDKMRDRRGLVFLCAFIGALGFGLVWAVPTPLAYISAFCLLIPFGNALFSQSFSYSRAYYNREEPARAELMMSLLRSAFTIAWVIVPPIAGWIAAETTAFAVFAVAAAAHVASTVLIGVLWAYPGARVGAASPGASILNVVDLPEVRIAAAHRLGIAGVTLVRTALQLNLTVLPLVILRDLGGTLAQVGINAAIAAAVEVPFMIAWGYAALRMRKETILAANCAILALYLGLMAVAQSVPQVMVLQAIAAIAIAALMSIMISYLQETIPGRVGLSTSIMDVTQVVSAMAAAAVFALNPGTSYGPLMAAAAALSLGGGFLMVAARRRARHETAPSMPSAGEPV